MRPLPPSSRSLTRSGGLPSERPPACAGRPLDNGQAARTASSLDQLGAAKTSVHRTAIFWANVSAAAAVIWSTPFGFVNAIVVFSVVGAVTRQVTEPLMATTIGGLAFVRSWTQTALSPMPVSAVPVPAFSSATDPLKLSAVVTVTTRLSPPSADVIKVQSKGSWGPPGMGSNWTCVIVSLSSTWASGNLIALQDRVCSEGESAVSYTHLRAHETDSYLVCR